MYMNDHLESDNLPRGSSLKEHWFSTAVGWLPVDYHVGEGAGVYNSFIIILWLRVWLLCLPLCLAHV